MLGHLPTDGNEALFQQPQEFGDLAGFLAAFGLALRPAVHERIDHVSCECGFLAFLACKEACALDVDPLDCDHRHEDVPMWEMKTGTVGSGVNCSTTTCSDPHDVNNRYQWCSGTFPNCSNASNPPDGVAFTDFLRRVNGQPCASSTRPGLGGHSDWRMPTLSELQTIVDLSATGCGTGSMQQPGFWPDQ